MTQGQPPPQAKREVRFGGTSAMEQHVRWHVGRRCKSCSQAGTVLFQIYAPKEEYLEKFYPQACAIIQKHGRLPEQVMDFKGAGPMKYVLVDRFAACNGCRVVAEKEAANAPSWWVVWIEWGPDSNRVTVAQTNHRAAR